MNVFLHSLNGAIPFHVFCSMAERTDPVSSDDDHFFEARIEHMLASAVSQPMALIVTAISVLDDLDVARTEIAQSLVSSLPELKPALQIPGFVVVGWVIVLVLCQTCVLGKQSFVSGSQNYISSSFVFFHGAGSFLLIV